jgi:hypothetical protein
MSKSNFARRNITLIHALNSSRGVAHLGRTQKGAPSHIAEQMRHVAKAPAIKDARAISLTVQEITQ